jgi:hypothetical protein
MPIRVFVAAGSPNLKRAMGPQRREVLARLIEACRGVGSRSDPKALTGF